MYVDITEDGTKVLSPLGNEPEDIKGGLKTTEQRLKNSGGLYERIRLLKSS